MERLSIYYHFAYPKPYHSTDMVVSYVVGRPDATRYRVLHVVGRPEGPGRRRLGPVSSSPPPSTPDDPPTLGGRCSAPAPASRRRGRRPRRRPTPSPAKLRSLALLRPRKPGDRGPGGGRAPPPAPAGARRRGRRSRSFFEIRFRIKKRQYGKSAIDNFVHKQTSECLPRTTKFRPNSN